jgi:uncharacterized integral membrane protein
MACIAVLILIVLIVFVAQNTASVRVTLFSFHGRFPLAVELLAAVAAGCVLTLGLGTTRILQLRRIVRQASPRGPRRGQGSPCRGGGADP